MGEPSPGIGTFVITQKVNLFYPDVSLAQIGLLKQIIPQKL